MSVNSVLNFNKGYNDSYIILPLKKEYNGLKVSTTSDTNARNIDKDILNELLAADRDKNNCLTFYTYSCKMISGGTYERNRNYQKTKRCT